MFKSIIILALLPILINCQASCPEPPVQTDLSLQSYSGSWYEIQRFPITAENDLKCINAEYTVLDETTIKVNNSGINEKNGNFDVTIGSAKVAAPGKLLVTFTFGPISVTSNYWVLETNYKYSLVYSCRVTFGQKSEFAWILSREDTLDATTVTALRNKLQANGIDPGRFLITNQSGCN